MPVITSSTPNSLVQVLAPGGHLIVKIGDAVDDRHAGSP
jgi:hypothetical protein